MFRYATAAWVALCRLLFVLVFVWPILALAWKCVSQGREPADGFTLSSRQLGLFWRSVWMASVASLGAVVLALPAARLLGRLGMARGRVFCVSALLLLLLCPPTVYAFGWERLLPVGFNPYARCIAVWMLWGWPVPAVLLGLGWARSGRAAYEAAAMETTRRRAFLYVTLPLMSKFLAFSVAVLFLFLLGEYGVPHACALKVFATELLGWAASSPRAIDVAWPAMLNVAVTIGTLVVVVRFCRRCAASELIDAGEHPPDGGTPIAAIYTALIFVIAWGVPLAALARKLDGFSSLAEAFTVYGRDLGWSLAVAGLAGVVAVAMGVGLATSGRWRSVGLLWALWMGALPAALVGEALIGAFNRAWLWWLYDYWPIVAIGYIARFGWVGMLVGFFAVRGSARRLADQARVDGASEAGTAFYVHLPLNLSTLLCGVAVVMALSMAELATTSLVRVPGYAPISLVLVEKFHRFEDGMLASLSLWLVAVCIPGIVFAVASFRRARS